jgi:DNA-binding transcriptional ArsR family regulator
MSLFFLTKIQEKVLVHVGESPQSVSEISKSANMPRTSVSRALEALESLNFVHRRKIRNKNMALYSRVSADILDEKITEFGEDVLKIKRKSKYSLANESSVEVYSGKKEISKAIHSFIDSKKGKRAYVLQAKRGTDWVEYLGEDDVLAIHKKLVENKLIVISFYSEETENLIRSRPVVRESIVKRITRHHILPNKIFEEKVALYISEGTVLFVNLKQGVAFKVEDRAFGTVLHKIFSHIAEFY